jgi:hypothetical protein
MCQQLIGQKIMKLIIIEKNLIVCITYNEFIIINIVTFKNNVPQVLGPICNN